MLSFNQIPANLLVPGHLSEFDDSLMNSGLAAQALKIVLFGHKLSAGSAPVGTLVRVNSAEEAKTLFGRGSMLARMAELYKLNDLSLPLYAVPVAEPAGVAATYTTTFTGTATAAGTVFLRVANQPVNVAVSSGMTAAQIATAAAAAINATPDLPVTAAASLGVVTSTMRHVGAVGNGLDIRVNYNRGEVLPAGISIAQASGTAGTSVADVAGALTAIADQPFAAIIHPYLETANLSLIKTALATRADAMRTLDTISLSAKIDTLSNHLTFGGTEDSEFSSILALKAACSPAWEIASAFGAQVMKSANVDPALPWTGLKLNGINVLDDRVQFSNYPECQFLLEAGLSTVDAKGGEVTLSRVVSTSKTNSLGLADQSMKSLNNILVLFKIRYTWQMRLAQKYPRHKLGTDGGNYGANSKVVTPKTLKAEALAIFKEWEELGLVENFDQFKRELVVERDANNKDRVNLILPPDLINQLLITATIIQPRL